MGDVCDRPGILKGEDAARGRHLGPRFDPQHVGSQAAHPFLHVAAGSFADREHDNHRGDADDDAEHGEEGAEAVCLESMKSHPERLGGIGKQGDPPPLRGLRKHGNATRFPRRRIRLGGALRRLIGNDRAVHNADHAVGHRGHTRIVGDEDDGETLPVKSPDPGHQLLAAGRVEGARRFVGQDYLPAVHERPRHGDTLLFAARELRRPVRDAVPETQSLQQADSPLPALPGGHPDVGAGQPDILGRRLVGQQVVALEDETERLSPRLGALVRREPGNVPPLQLEASGRRRIHQAEDVHQRGLSRSGGTDDGDEFTRFDPQVDAV